MLLSWQDGDDDDDVFDAADGACDLPGGEAEFPMSQDMTSEDMTFGDSSQGLSFTNESVVDQTLFTGDGLVAQPNKVQFSSQYSSCMWQTITDWLSKPGKGVES